MWTAASGVYQSLIKKFVAHYRGVFGTQSNVYDGIFFVKTLEG